MVAIVLMGLMTALCTAAGIASWLGAARPAGSTMARRTLIPDATTDEDKGHRRRRAARQWNERLKLVATFLNGTGIALFVALAVTLPGRTSGPSLSDMVVGLLSAIALLMLGLFVLSMWKTEE